MFPLIVMEDGLAFPLPIWILGSAMLAGLPFAPFAKRPLTLRARVGQEALRIWAKMLVSIDSLGFFHALDAV